MRYAADASQAAIQAGNGMQGDGQGEAKWIEHPPGSVRPPEIRAEFLTMSKAHQRHAQAGAAPRREQMTNGAGRACSLRWRSESTFRISRAAGGLTYYYGASGCRKFKACS